MPNEAASPMLVAVVAALNNDGTLDPLITGVFSGRAPAGSILDYIVIVDMTETGSPKFAAAGQPSRVERGEMSIRIWAKDFQTAAVIYGHVKRLLHRKKLAPVGYAHLNGKVELVTTIPDPTDTQSVQSVVNYEWMAHVSP